MFTPSLPLIGSSLCLAALIGSLPGHAPPDAEGPLSTQADALAGAWAADEYVLSSGDRHAVRGRIVFTDSEWQVLFHHLSYGRTMAGLPASPLAMTARDGEGPFEPTGVEVDGDALTLRFPSGNSMSFTRSSACCP